MNSKFCVGVFMGEFCICEFAMVDGTLMHPQMVGACCVVILGEGRGFEMIAVMMEIV